MLTSHGKKISTAAAFFALAAITAVAGPWVLSGPDTDWTGVLAWLAFLAVFGAFGALAVFLYRRPQTILVLDERGVDFDGGRMVIPWGEIKSVRTEARSVGGRPGLFTLDDPMMYYVVVEMLHPDRFDDCVGGEEFFREVYEMFGNSGYPIEATGADRTPEEIAELIRAGTEVLGADHGGEGPTG